MRGFIVGILVLTGLQAVVSQGGSGRVGQAFGVAAAVIDHIINPAVPGIPDLRSSSTTATGSASTAPATTTTPQWTTTVSPPRTVNA